jgi:hypothetical protein
LVQNSGRASLRCGPSRHASNCSQCLARLRVAPGLRPVTLFAWALYLQSFNAWSSLRSFLTHWSLPVFNHFGTPRKRACFGLLHSTQRTGIPPSGSIRSRSFALFASSALTAVPFRCSYSSIAVRNLHRSRYGSISCPTGRCADLKRHPCLSPSAGKKRARPSAAGSCHPSPFGLSVWHRGLHSQSARTSFLRFGATRSFLTHCTFRPTAGSRLFFLTRSFFELQVSSFEEKKRKFRF